MVKKLIFPFIIIITAVYLWATGIGEHITLGNIITHKDYLLTQIDENLLLSLLICGGIYATIVALSLPFATPLTLAAGFLFGFIMGTALVVISATIGATIIFLVARSSFGGVLREKAGKLYDRAEKDMNDNAVSYLLFLRLVPLFPFFIINILPALFNVKARTFIMTTLFGILPGTAVFVNVGRSLETIENPSDLVSKDIILAIALLGVVALIPVIYQKIKKRKST